MGLTIVCEEKTCRPCTRRWAQQRDVGRVGSEEAGVRAPSVDVEVPRSRARGPVGS